MTKFHLSKEEARTALLLCLVLFAVTGVSIALLRCGGQSEDEAALTASDKEQLSELEASVKEDSLHRRERFAPAQLAKELFVFDPNHADSATLRRLGLSEWQVANMMKYRRRGGRWRSEDDFQRLYGLSKDDFRRLRPYICIAAADRRASFVPFDRPAPYGTPVGEKPSYEPSAKMKEGETLGLNAADTTALKTIPGIGSYYASKIVHYRERLGGFVSTAQIDEIEGLPAGCSRWFTLDSPEGGVKKIRINQAKFKELVRHPYLSYEQVKDIVNHIRQYGPLHSWRDLRLYKEFTEQDFARLAPYFTFD